jgi:outer membrane receptor for ferrienterochelin and colicins
MPLGMHIVTLGASAERQELSDQTTNRISDRTDIDRDIWALFAEDEWMLTETFALTGGLRFDHDEKFDSHLSPRLYGVWNPTRQWTLKGGVSIGFRAPDLRELTADFGQVSRGGNVYGNPDLEPETSLNKEIAVLYGADWGGNASVTVFHNDFDDKITRVSCPIDICTAGPNQFGADPTYRINVDEAITQGVEVALSAPVSTTVDVSASYTYTDSEQKSGEYEGEPLTQLPKHLFSASANWQATQNIASWARLTYRGEESQPTTGPSQSALIAPSYTFVDAGMGYALTDATTLNVGVYNLFDEDVNYEEYGFVEDGRRYWLGVNVEF